MTLIPPSRSSYFIRSFSWNSLRASDANSSLLTPLEWFDATPLQRCPFSVREFDYERTSERGEDDGVRTGLRIRVTLDCVIPTLLEKSRDKAYSHQIRKAEPSYTSIRNSRRGRRFTPNFLYVFGHRTMSQVKFEPACYRE